MRQDGSRFDPTDLEEMSLRSILMHTKATGDCPIPITGILRTVILNVDRLRSSLLILSYKWNEVPSD
jgi:hypothetical protein